MPANANPISFRHNLADLQMRSVRAIALFAGVIGYIWFLYLVWPVTGGAAPFSAWIGISLLVGCLIASICVLDEHLSLSVHLLVWGTLGAAGCAVLAFGSLTVAYLFIVPIVSASMLLRPWTLLSVTGLVIGFTILYGVVRLSLPLLDIFMPVVVSSLVAIASWLSVQNLYTMLTWLWHAYEQARTNEEMARNRQAELRRVLKSLDEATARFERANYMLNQAYDQAHQMRRLKQQFTQNISHELRTPLNIIVSFSELMAQSPEYYGDALPPAYMRDLSIIYRNAQHLQGLVNDVLDLARIDAAQMNLMPETVDPTALVREAVNTARSLVESRGLTLKTEIEPHLPTLWLDPIRIRQVLFNLLNNAARFTSQGSVTVRVYRQDASVIFAVVDTGVGIAAQDIPHIFNEFQQVDGSTRRLHEGAGLGLAISRNFVELHGGRIWVESELDRGSTFFFSLPITPLDRTPLASNHTGSVAQLTPVWNDNDPVLLLVTRSPSAAALLTRYIRDCRVVVMSSLAQGRRAAKQLSPQVILIDRACESLDLPQLEALAHDWDIAETPFVACPLPGEEPLRQRFAVNGYLLKPITHKNLWNTLRQFGDAVDTILVIDDNRDFVRMMSRMLDSPRRRYQVLRSYSGRAGVAMFARHCPDLVLLDLMLPDLTGMEIIERIRQHPVGRDVPIVVVSAQDEIDYIKPKTGSLLITKTGGFTPNEIFTYIQNACGVTSQLSIKESLPRATHPATPAL